LSPAFGQRTFFSFCGCKVKGFFLILQILFQKFFAFLKSSQSPTERGFQIPRDCSTVSLKAAANIETISGFATPPQKFFLPPLKRKHASD
jgi:hypothetical protein